MGKSAQKWNGGHQFTVCLPASQPVVSSAPILSISTQPSIHRRKTYFPNFISDQDHQFTSGNQFDSYPSLPRSNPPPQPLYMYEERKPNILVAVCHMISHVTSFFCLLQKLIVCIYVVLFCDLSLQLYYLVSWGGVAKREVGVIILLYPGPVSGKVEVSDHFMILALQGAWLGQR